MSMYRILEPILLTLALSFGLAHLARSLFPATWGKLWRLLRPRSAAASTGCGSGCGSCRSSCDSTSPQVLSETKIIKHVIH